MLATPLGYIQRIRLRSDVARILEHATETQAEGIIVGIPLALNGSAGHQARRVVGFVDALRKKTDLSIDTMDERYSTAEAERLLRQAGRQPSRHRGDVDAAAATVILQDYLDRMRRQGNS